MGRLSDIFSSSDYRDGLLVDLLIDAGTVMEVDPANTDMTKSLQSKPQADGSTFDEESTDLRAVEIADILEGMFGDDAERMFDEAFGDDPEDAPQAEIKKHLKGTVYDHDQSVHGRKKQEYEKLPQWVKPRAEEMWKEGGEEWQTFVDSAESEGIDGELVGEYFQFKQEEAERLEEMFRPRVRTPNPQVQTPQFKNWFGRSQVVDDKGDPLVVYHGTGHDFKEFRQGAVDRMSTRDSKQAFFFSNDPGVAEEWSWKDGEKVGSIMPVYLRSERMLEAKGTEFYDPKHHLDTIMRAKADGYDGVVFRNQGSLEGRSDHYAVFAPEQIKSASANDGGFDPANPDITKQYREEDHPRGDDGRWINKTAIIDAVADERIAAGLLRATTDPVQRQILLESFVHHGMTEDTARRAINLSNWFGDSVVVDGSGAPALNDEIDGKSYEPIVAYHGTSRGGWNTFDKSRQGDPDQLLYGPGFYFTEDDGIAEEYTSNHDAGKETMSQSAFDKWSQELADKLPPAHKLIEMPGYSIDGSRNLVLASDDGETRLIVARTSSMEPGKWDVWQDTVVTLEAYGLWDVAKFVDRSIEKPEVKQVYLKIANPVDIEHGVMSHDEASEFVGRLSQMDWSKVPLIIKGKVAADLGEVVVEGARLKGQALADFVTQFAADSGGEGVPHHSIYDHINGTMSKAAANWIFQQAGFDGITHVGGRNIGSRDHKVWIAFEPNQIKSATDNDGTFDPTNPDITKRWYRRGAFYQIVKEWREIDHPRGPDGRFIHKNSPEALAAARARIAMLLNMPRTPESMRQLAENLSILTVSQLRQLKKEFGIKAAIKRKAEFVEKIANRLDSGRRREEHKDVQVSSFKAEDVKRAATDPHMAALMMLEADRDGESDALMGRFKEAGMDASVLHQATIMMSGKYNRDHTRDPLSWMGETLDKAKADGIEIPDRIFRGLTTDEDMAQAMENYLSPRPKSWDALDEVVKSARKSSPGRKPRAIDDFSHNIKPTKDVFPLLEHYSNDREGKLAFIRDTGYAYDIDQVSGYEDRLVDDIVSNVQRRQLEKLTRDALSSIGALAHRATEGIDRDLDDAERMDKLYKLPAGTTARRLENERALAEMILTQRGGIGSQTHDWTRETFRPKQSFEEIKEWWRERGVYAGFEMADDVEPGIEERYSLEDANVISGRVTQLLRQYPETEIRQIGLAYTLDQQAWEDNYRLNLWEEYQKKAQSGKRFSRPAAQKRVLDMMVDPPTKVLDTSDPKAADRERYSIFKMAWFDGIGKSLIYNHRAKIFVESEEQSEAERERQVERAEQGKKVYGLDNVAVTMKSLTDHEFSHALDFTFTDEELRHGKTEAGISKELKGIRDRFSDEDVAAQLSDYATTNMMEFMAEGFAESQLSDARPLGREIRAKIDSVYKEKAAIHPYKKAIKASVKLEEKIRMDRTESLHVFTTDGKEIHAIGGDKGQVSFTPEVGKSMLNTVVTHNHPAGWDYTDDDTRRAGNSFSFEDLNVFARFGIKQMRVVSPRYRFIMTAPEVQQDESLRIANSALLRHQFEKIKSDISDKWWKLIRAAPNEAETKRVVENAESRSAHEYSEAIAKVMGWKYEAKHIPGSGKDHLSEQYVPVAAGAQVASLQPSL